MKQFSLPHGLQLDDHAMITRGERGAWARGLVRLEKFSEADGEVWLRLDVPEQGRTLSISHEAADILQPVVGRDDALNLLAGLQVVTTTGLTWSTSQYVTSMKLLDVGTLADMQVQLAALYAMRVHTRASMMMVARYESLLVTLIAHAIGAAPGTLVQQLRAGRPALHQLPPAVAEPILQPPQLAAAEIPGHEALFPFETRGQLVIGQRLDRIELPATTVMVEPGRWHAYWTAYDEPEDDLDDQAPPPTTRELLLLHADRIAAGDAAGDAVPAPGDWRIAGALERVTRGGNIQVIDRAALNDEALIDQMFYLAGTQQYGGRGLCVLGERWEGAREIYVAPSSGLPTAIKIALGDPANT